MKFIHTCMGAFCLILSCLSGQAYGMGVIDYDLVYRVQWGDSLLGTARAKWQMDEVSYRFEGHVKSEGTLSYLYQFEGQNTLTGERQNDSFRPMNFTSQSDYDDEIYTVDMSWPKGIKTPIFKVEPEPKQKEIHPLRKATLRNVVDPYTAMLMALADLTKTGRCEGKYRVFDGRRRSELHLKDFGTTELTSEDGDGFQGTVQVCGSASKLIGGHKLDSDYDPEEELDFERVKIFIGKADGETFMPVRIDMTGFLGSISAHLDLEASRLN